MTVYNDASLDWEGLSDDDVPSGFTERWDASSDFDIATVDSKKALYNLTAVSNNMYLFSHDSASADADSDDVEVLCKFRVGSVSSYNYVIAIRRVEHRSQLRIWWYSIALLYGFTPV